jgi:hypothetical protein
MHDPVPQDEDRQDDQRGQLLGAAVTGALEGAWLSACLVGALGLARR